MLSHVSADVSKGLVAHYLGKFLTLICPYACPFRRLSAYCRLGIWIVI